MNNKQIFAEKKFPSFIANHKVFKSYKEIKKIFPEIGLPNCEKETNISNDNDAKNSALFLVQEIVNAMYRRETALQRYKGKKAFGKRRENKHKHIIHLLCYVRYSINNCGGTYIQSNNGRITLNLPTDINDLNGKVVFRKGEGLFRVYNKLNDILREGHFLAMQKLENLYYFKDFSAKNVPNTKYKVVFSSDGSEGLWDIATMSMRGIASCQTWDNGAHYTKIVGSMADPFTGIIYLTSGTKHSNYGTKMMRRCVVRFVVNETKKAPTIVLEKMYPSYDKQALDAFTSLIKERTDNKFNVSYIPDSYQNGKFYVPMSKIVRSLPVNNQPYRDSGMLYKDDLTDLKNSVIAEFRHKLNGSFFGKLKNIGRSMDISKIAKSQHQAFKAFIAHNNGSIYDYSEAIAAQIIHSIVEHLKKSPEIETITCGEQYLKSAINDLLSLDIKKIICLPVIKRYYPGTKQYGFGVKLSSATFNKIAASGEKIIVEYMNNELKKIKIPKTPKTVKSDDTIYSKFLN